MGIADKSRLTFLRRLCVLPAFVALWSLHVVAQQLPVTLFITDTTFTPYPLCIGSSTDPLYTTIVHPPLAPEWHSMVTNIPSDIRLLGSSMVEKKNLPLLAGVVLATIGLRTVDTQIWDWTKPNIPRHKSSSSFNRYLVEIGDGRTHFGIAGAFAAYGFISDDHRALRTASQTVEAILVTGFVVQVIKRMTGKESPAAAGSPDGIWRPFPAFHNYERHPSRYYSFPSGHTATTMALITVISQNYPEWKWFKPVGFTLLGLVEIGLINAGMHWLSDFPLAMVLGYTCGMIVSERGISQEDGIPIDHNSTITFRPVLTPVGPAVGVSLCF